MLFSAYRNLDYQKFDNALSQKTSMKFDVRSNQEK